MPIYKAVITTLPDAIMTRLIDAKNQAMALRHATSKHVVCEKATPQDLNLLGRDGIEIERASDE